MIYLVVGVDQYSLAPWHANIAAGNVRTAKQAALARAQARGINLAVAAVIGPNMIVLADPRPVAAVRAAAA